MRPNERFSGRGHARHLCKECAKLGQEELAYRQAVDAERSQWNQRYRDPSRSGRQLVTPVGTF
jgi:hypothetical protein